MRKLLSSLALVTVCGSIAAAQSGAGYRLSVRPESKLWIEGTSTVHEWSCKAGSFDSAITADGGYGKTDAVEVTRSLHSATVTVPVKSLNCGHDKMTDNMYKALEAEKYPTIKYVLTQWTVQPGATTGSFNVRATGTLTIHGVTRPVTMDVVAGKRADGSAHATGSLPVLMTDFGMKPVTAMFGAIKQGNQVTVKFDISVTPEAVVASAAGGR